MEEGWIWYAIYETDYGVMVLQTSMLNWRRGWRSIWPWVYMYFVLYMKLIWWNAIPEIICCNGFPEIYALLEEGWGQSSMDIYALCYIAETYLV